MACFRLSDEIWWGDMQCPVSQAGQYRSLLDLASNYVDDGHHYRIGQIPRDALIFRLPTNEDVPLDEVSRGALEGILDVVGNANAYPLLIHCMAGQCRSPIVAAFAEWRLGLRSAERLQSIYENMWSLRADIDDKRRFHASLMAWMQQTSSMRT